MAQKYQRSYVLGLEPCQEVEKLRQNSREGRRDLPCLFAKRVLINGEWAIVEKLYLPPNYVPSLPPSGGTHINGHTVGINYDNATLSGTIQATGMVHTLAQHLHLYKLNMASGD